jgi:hypothetical protein
LTISAMLAGGSVADVGAAPSTASNAAKKPTRTPAPLRPEREGEERWLTRISYFL